MKSMKSGIEVGVGCNEGVEKEVKNENFVIDDDDEYGR